ncbi:bifunctional DNA primase/polymerase [Acidocella aminolytica]|uniref:DNA recombinase/resolvase n=1 Tax=Acidocella aminolytica 101 = DSM 11237 TaxID=1120923 RepID=A0A0D6PG37_9PROT|nr:bifunctional DNA primase/polymerase [Acidocella aminolytica]GAN79804.1 DNA recombinase/resolvase [Acidocella aminolytica 101 = DSM 11237]GBQ34309.1 DNA recombinase [Acidocella aminolytica 101 = DSM 11237]SHF36577.1 Bifunctional DNA primase/polymerase, N-terminal [Acidocella aminolytica 101 = DSM 11237]
MTALPQEIEALALLGWRLYPASTRSRAALVSQFKDGAKPHELATHDLDQLETWARRFPGCNWRVVMEGSGIIGLDVDAPGDDHNGDGITALRDLVAKNTPLPPRPTTRSGSGGFALFFRDNGAPICRRSGWPVAGLDPRAGPLTVTVPPSTHLRTRNAYRWAPGLAPWECPLPEAPAWLLKALAPPPEPPIPKRMQQRPATEPRARRRLERAVDNVQYAKPGTRNAELNRQSYAVGRYVGAGLLDQNYVISVLYTIARKSGLADKEARDTIRSGMASGVRNPVTTTGNE